MMRKDRAPVENSPMLFRFRLDKGEGDPVQARSGWAVTGQED